MARPAQITRETLAPLIRARGPVSATELAALLRVNRTTIARTLPDFGDELVTLGATRSTRYLLRRSVRNIGNRWPVYRIGEEGRAAGVGRVFHRGKRPVERFPVFSRRCPAPRISRPGHRQPNFQNAPAPRGSAVLE